LANLQLASDAISDLFSEQDACISLTISPSKNPCDIKLKPANLSASTLWQILLLKLNQI
jgi:hypothetical protein